MTTTTKADRLRQQREERFRLEQARQKLEAEQLAKMTIKPRNKVQMDECKAAEAKVAARKAKP
jgi:hypothetical protein